MGVSRRDSIVAVVVFLTVAAGLALWWRGRATPAGAPTVSADVVAQQPDSTTPGIARLSAVQTPLPDDGTPLRLVFDGLKQRANGGDARAACRLAAELEQCERVRVQLAQFDEQLDRRMGMEEMVAGNPQATAERRESTDRMFADRGQQLLQASEQCDGVPFVSPAERASLWRSAALGGSLPALTQYAVGNAFRTRDTLDLLPQLQVYRNEAESLALQAAQRGSTRATLALAAAYSPSRDTGRRTYLAQVVTPDAGKSLALYLQAQRAFTAESSANGRPSMRQASVNRSIDALRRGMDAAQIAQAESQAARWRQDWAAPIAAEPGSTFSRDGGTSDIEPQACSK
ncbi:hypothetical protein [Pseudoxanthomonas sp.]|uniref:hypothetical protein n=1 Tax=Pseudoxanthomonas sp. TaxID=1871049 RepID=UPI002634F03E|nr:hypothetical protein [Pseudoxanthomonas sp.]WDS35404.1 MAG: hypothetical protein O8I58_13760 [Pseudoxanthomonas sp.]